VRGIVLGTFPRCDEPGGAPTARGALADALADFPGPIVFGFPTGHVDGPAMTMPLGVRARLVAGATTRLIIEEAAVE
jgi:muramoyltetrapeptide carboxypeptidase LdcA involved in peptidoglycan recycling